MVEVIVTDCESNSINDYTNKAMFNTLSDAVDFMRETIESGKVIYLRYVG
jgi:hypothetical protein